MFVKFQAVNKSLHLFTNRFDRSQ